MSDWEDVTAAFFERIYNSEEGVDVMMIEDATVEIDLTNQNTNRRRKLKTIRPRGLVERILQQEQTPPSESTESVVVTYTQYMSYDGRNPVVSMDTILKYPLSTPDYQQQYVDELKNLEGYEELAKVSGISTSADAADTSEAKLTTAQVTGIVIGIVVFVLIVVGGFVYFMAKNDPADGNERRRSARGVTQGGGTPTAAIAAGAPRTLGDMSVASDDDHYFVGPEGADEELLTIYAPSGRLGIVLDSPDTGAPVIHDVKESSPILDRVQVGDRLVAIDEEDVRAMSAVKVSKLISKKSGEGRKLTIIRYVVPEAG